MDEIRKNLALGRESQEEIAMACCSRLDQLDGDLLLVKIVGAGSQVDLPHAAFTEQAEDFVIAEPLADGLAGLRDLSGGHPQRILEKSPGPVGGIQKIFDLAAQLGIVRAGAIEESGPLVGFEFESRIEQLFQLPPVIFGQSRSP